MLFLNLVKEHHQAYQFVMYGIHFPPCLQCSTLAYIRSSVISFVCHNSLNTINKYSPFTTAILSSEKIFYRRKTKMLKLLFPS